MAALDKHLAKQIIGQLGGPGQPPEFGVQYFSVGLERYLDVITQEYLTDFVKDGGSAFKLVVGIYGGGKTHFLYCVRDEGWRHGFAVSYVSLTKDSECPFDKLDLVYKEIVNGLLPPITGSDLQINEVKGIENFLQHWYSQQLLTYQRQGKSVGVAKEEIKAAIDTLAASSVHSISFRNAIVLGLRAAMHGDDRTYNEICQWLKGEGPPSLRLKTQGVTQKVDKTTAFSLIRSLGQVMKLLGYSGLLFLLDEAELIPSLGRNQRDQLLANLRAFIDVCGTADFRGVMVFYAVPNRGFLDGRGPVYQALNQRLESVFSFVNPRGVSIQLDNAIDNPTEFLCAVGEKILPIYNTAYSQSLSIEQVKPLIDGLSNRVVQMRFADAGYKRVFVQRFIHGLGIVHREQRIPSLDELV